MKTCPYCAEDIQDAAIKCRHCGSDLPAAGRSVQNASGSYMGPPCPKCASRVQHSGPWPWYLGTIGAMLMKVVVCDQCGTEFDSRKPHANLASRKRNLAILINGIGLVGITMIVGGLVFLIMKVMR